MSLQSPMFVTLKFDGASIGAVYSSLGIAAVFMPALLGIVADKSLLLLLNTAEAVRLTRRPVRAFGGCSF